MLTIKTVPTARWESVYSPGIVLISLSLGLSSSPHFLAHAQYFWNTVLPSVNAQLIKLIVISISFCSLALCEFLFIMPLQVHTRALNCRAARASLPCSPHKTSDGLATLLHLLTYPSNALCQQSYP